MQVGDRIRPFWKKTYKAKYEWFTAEFNLDHHQLWSIESIKDGIYTLSNSSYTMKLMLDERALHEHFNTGNIASDKHSGR